nr:ABC-type uncharacterized transport system, permease component [Streptococcus thermophilus]
MVIPVLWPAILGSLLLLFANAFAAYATAFALAGGSLNLVPILIGFFISGNVLLKPGPCSCVGHLDDAHHHRGDGSAHLLHQKE